MQVCGTVVSGRIEQGNIKSGEDAETLDLMQMSSKIYSFNNP